MGSILNLTTTCMTYSYNWLPFPREIVSCLLSINNSHMADIMALRNIFQITKGLRQGGIFSTLCF